ncbi:MAG TPA: MarR family transcriptional regulator [Chloroflexota bacterium]
MSARDPTMSPALLPKAAPPHLTARDPSTSPAFVPEAAPLVAALPTTWSFLTNHALVLIHVGQRPESTGLDIAQAVGITERAARKIVGDLQTQGYIQREKIGRRNRYRMDLHHPVIQLSDRSLTVGQLLEFVHGDKTPEQQEKSA